MIAHVLALALIGFTGAAEVDDPVENAAQALARGAAAEAAGDGRAMLAAARAVEALGLRGDNSPASRWRELARAKGVRDAAPPYRGRVLGPAFREGLLAPGAVLNTDQLFLAGQKAVVAVVPQPARQLSLHIVARDRRICDQPDAGPRASCTWVPLFTDRVQISVVNRGKAPARYYLVSN